MICRPFIAALITTVISVGAQAQTANDAAVSACKATGLLALKEKSKDITDLVIDVESVAVRKADSKVEDVAIKTVVIGEAYIARNGATGKPDRFVCLLGGKGSAAEVFYRSAIPSDGGRSARSCGEFRDEGRCLAPFASKKFR